MSKLSKLFSQLTSDEEKSALALLLAFCDAFEQVYKQRTRFSILNPVGKKYWNFLIRTARKLEAEGIDFNVYSQAVVKEFVRIFGMDKECKPFILGSVKANEWYHEHMQKIKFKDTELIEKKKDNIFMRGKIKEISDQWGMSFREATDFLYKRGKITEKVYSELIYD